MPILTKTPVVKGESSVFTLSKSDLINHPTVAADPDFNDLSKWSKVVVQYKESSIGQGENIVFDVTLAGNTANGSFEITDKAKDIFEVDKLFIYDFDNDFIIIDRSQLNTSEFDVDLSVSADYILTEEGIQVVTEDGEYIVVE